ncbi:MAG: hypothetical protein ACRYFK_12665 [Janthinobacterium lividum]
MKKLRFSLLLGAAALARPAAAQAPDIFKMSPEERTAYLAKQNAAAQVDWQQMIDQLHLTLPALPPPADDPRRPAGTTQRPGSPNWYDPAGYMYVRSAWGSWSNYDEVKAGSAALPDVLTLKNGRPVRDAKTWWQQRRPEILRDYQQQVYGTTPAHTPRVTFEVTATEQGALDGRATKKTIVGHIDNSRYPAATPSLTITLYLPAQATGPVPVLVVAGGFFGPFPGQPAPKGPSALDLALAAGWGVAGVPTGSIQQDSGAGLREGIIGLMNEGRPRQPTDWGVLTAWSWGMSRALDYLQTDKSVNPEAIGIEGHSRWGKTALLAAALDPRFAIVYASCSGSMGASLEKRSYGENIDNVAGPGEYHWMAGNFLQYGGRWDALPVDAHDLMALVAPRPLFVTGGTHDSWSDPHGEFLACVGASPVYQLLGKKGLSSNVMPAPDVAAADGDLAFRLHEGGHTDLPDWPVFLAFAGRYFKASPAR